MNKTTKTILIVIGSLLLLCLCTTAALIATGYFTFRQIGRAQEGVYEEIFSVDSESAVQVGSEIAGFEVPEGFGSPEGIHIGDLTLITYKSQDGESNLLLAQFPAGTSINIDEMYSQLKEENSIIDHFLFDLEMTPVEQRQVYIRGQETTLSISDGDSLEHGTYRIAAVTFEGRGGPALVVIGFPINEWDDEIVENFISSIY